LCSGLRLSSATSNEQRTKEQVSLALEQHKRQLAVQSEQLTARDKSIASLQREIEHITVEYRKLEQVLRIRMTENKNCECCCLMPDTSPFVP
jgi:hypothetical protein